MKWIGQHIWSLISRFRNDVYLENVTESAQDHVVGIDADGKLYKQDVSTGDITGVTITTDSGGGSAASDTSGSADFSILGSSGVDVTNSGTTITATAVPAEIDHDSLNNFVANEHIDWTADQGATNINAGNYTNTTYTSSDFDHDSLTNYVAAEHYRWDNDNSGTATIHTNNITDLHGAGVDGSADQLLTDDGDGSVTSEASLTYDSETLTIGNDDNGITGITRLAHSDGAGGSLTISGGSATNGQTNQAGGNLFLRTGAATGNAAAGSFTFFTSPTGASGTTIQAHREIAVLNSASDRPTLYMYEAPGSTSDYFMLQTLANGATTMRTVDAAGANANMSIITDGGFDVNASGTASIVGTDITLNASNNIEINADGGQVVFKDDTTTLATISSSGYSGKQYQVFPSNFIDDIGTSQVFIPIHGTTFEQSTVYQDDVAIIAPCDGRVVSVAISVLSLTGSGNLTIKVYTRGPDNSGTSLANWTEEESETLAFTSTDDNHVFHFAFSNAKHFESTEKIALSIQSDSDPGTNTYWYATTVIEWDYSTLLGGTSAEYDSAP